MTRRNTVIALLFALAAAQALAGKELVDSRATVVGQSQSVKIEPDLAQSRRSAGGWTWSQTVRLPGASFLKIHLVNVNLRAKDRLLVRTPEGRVIETIAGRGPRNMGTFWALSVPGDGAVLEFVFQESYRRLPFTVDKVIAGNAAMLAASGMSERSLCGAPDFEDAICYQDDAAKWSNVQASVGVMSVGQDADVAMYCSGSNISPRNYILTNNHCVASQAQCDNTEYVFHHYRTGCNDGSAPIQDWVSFRCDQVLESEPLLDCDAGPGQFDFSLTSVIGEPATTFGYVQPDTTPLSDGETLYIVQHPSGRPHEITHGSDSEVDGTVLRYWNTLDTESGSSGSPIFRESDDALVGLHHCGGCSNPAERNRGMLMTDLHPLIESYLCTETDNLVPAQPGPLVELVGNTNGVPEPGETWSFVPRVLNVSCSGSITNAAGTITLLSENEANITLLDTIASFGTVVANETTEAAGSIRFEIDASAQCGDLIAIGMDPLLTDQGQFAGAAQIISNLGVENFETVAFADFSIGIPPEWTVNDLGTGAGVAQTWSADNPGNRPLPLTAPFLIADSDLHDGLMDEELLMPAVDASGYQRVVLQFTHDFNWYELGANEQADIDVRSAATLGGWLNVANFSGADASGSVSLDISQWAAADLEVKFRYYGAFLDWWWAIDDVALLGSTGFQCSVPDDADTDGLPDGQDNCVAASNPAQIDTDGDGIGNACDADIDPSNNCLVDFNDVSVLRTAFLTRPGTASWNADADFDNSDYVDFLDLVMMRDQFLGAPGPSGIPNDCELP
ncbi:MAG: serine protease [Gammaproteobacteria bacterium]|nr:serine protease [Gammaproteobacteria bacterium]